MVNYNVRVMGPEGDTKTVMEPLEARRRVVELLKKGATASSGYGAVGGYNVALNKEYLGSGTKSVLKQLEKAESEAEEGDTLEVVIFPQVAGG